MGPAYVRFAFFVAVTLFARTGAAEVFSWQVSGGLHRNEFSSSSEIDTTTLQATYYFQPVDDTLGPLAVSPFLSRSSRIAFSAQRVNLKRRVLTAFFPGTGLFRPAPRTIFTTEESAIYSLRGRHVWQDSGWFVGGGAQYHDLDDPFSSAGLESERHKDGVELVGGKYFGATTAVWITANSSTETANTAVNVFSFPPTDPPLQFLSESDIETNTVSIAAMHVGGSTGLRYAVSGAAVTSDTKFTSFITRIPSGAAIPFRPGIGGIASYGVATGPFTVPSAFSLDSQETYSVTGELFPTNRLGVRIGYTSYSDFGALDERYEIAAKWFFRRAAAVEFVVARSTFDTVTSGIDQDEARIRFIGRL